MPLNITMYKLSMDNSLMNVLTVYAPHSGKPEEEKENFWNELFRLVSCMYTSE